MNDRLTTKEIQEIQFTLARLGIDPGPVDGIMGPRTESAIIAFKRSRGLRARPYVGPLTWAALRSATPADKPNLPPWIVEANKVVGLHEVIHNKKLSEWLKSDGHFLGDPSKLPWCGDYVETSIRLGLPDEPIPTNPYWALNWQKFGEFCGPTLHCIASIERNGGGHVGFIMGQDKTRYYMLGGNQSNVASIVPVSKSRFTRESFRWPSTYRFPKRFYVPPMSSDLEANTQES